MTFFSFFKTNTENTNYNEYKNTQISSTFKLPIEYLDDKYVSILPDNVCKDLELAEINSNNPNIHQNLSCYDNNKCIYEHLFTPDNVFALNNIQQWKRKFTTYTPFLKDTQAVIKGCSKYKNTINQDDCNNINTETILRIWYNTKDNKYFHDKYNYLDWDMLKHLNESSSFLQILSFIHLSSPIISLILPLLILIFPFIILKIQGIDISVDVYIDTIKTISKNHFIGKMLFNMKNLNFNNLIYLCCTAGLYIYQMYHNISICNKFYNNIIHMNDDLLYLQNYLKYSINSMRTFVDINSNKSSYRDFCSTTQIHIENLDCLYNQLLDITPFANTFNKFNHIGYMLKMYYVVFSNPIFDDSIRYSVGFEGYINNICNLHTHYKNNIISFCKFSKKNKCSFKNQYYPAIIDVKPILNNTNVSKNIIISAPNKAGKTTLIKSTLINIILSQQIGCGFYSNACLTPYKYIHSYLNIPDTSNRDSLFQAESRRCKDIIEMITNNNNNDRHFCIFDELYSGTNPDEAICSAKAFLKYLLNFSNVNFILTTHYTDICNHFNNNKQISNYKMNVLINNYDSSFNYTYKLIKGISKIKGGVRVLKDMNYPTEIIDDIENKQI